ncbi:MAG: nucleotide exchange factor GrpE [Bacilli bacterium]|nr:nucleotide exchange factor GrpE [Bacilli bacterium]
MSDKKNKVDKLKQEEIDELIEEEKELEEELDEELEEELDEELEEVELDEVASLEKELNDLKDLNKKLENDYFKAYADAQNLSKRAKIDAENMVNRKISSVINEILPAIDNFERALNIKVDDDNLSNFLKGFEMIYQQLTTALANEGVKEIECVGLEFDPNLHQSIGSVNDENYDSNIVVEELQKGYIYKDKVIRPSLVKVNE